MDIMFPKMVKYIQNGIIMELKETWENLINTQEEVLIQRIDILQLIFY